MVGSKLGFFDLYILVIKHNGRLVGKETTECRGSREFVDQRDNGSGVPSQSVKRHTLVLNKVSGIDNAKLF